MLSAFGLIYSGASGIGDWARVVDGWEPAWLWRAGLAIVGVALYFLAAPRVLMPPLEPFLGRDPATRETKARRLSLVPYLVGGASLVLAGLLNPLGMKIVLISAVAASFGSTSLLAWYPALPRRAAAGTPDTQLAIDRGRAWIGGAVTVLFVFVLGPGIGSVRR